MTSHKNIPELVLHHERILHDVLNNTDIPAPRIVDAMKYCLFPGGKRLRPILVYLCGDLIKADQQSLDFIAAAIELIHCYSLVHDDLPAMDNDDLRRGKPTCHRAFDEATAILVGDALQSLAIDVLLTHLPNTLTPRQTVDVTLELVKASGASGMVSGQSLDFSELTNPKLSELTLCKIHRLKTGKLISSCVNMVIEASHAAPTHATALRQFADHLGLAFQMQDDYLDEYDQGKSLGKSRASDAANQKITYAKLYNQHELTNLIATCFQQALEALTPFGQEAEKLSKFIRKLHQRSVSIPQKICE